MWLAFLALLHSSTAKRGNAASIAVSLPSQSHSLPQNPYLVLIDLTSQILTLEFSQTLMRNSGHLPWDLTTFLTLQVDFPVFVSDFSLLHSLLTFHCPE